MVTDPTTLRRRSRSPSRELCAQHHDHDGRHRHRYADRLLPASPSPAHARDLVDLEWHSALGLTIAAPPEISGTWERARQQPSPFKPPTRTVSRTRNLHHHGGCGAEHHHNTLASATPGQYSQPLAVTAARAVTGRFEWHSAHGLHSTHRTISERWDSGERTYGQVQDTHASLHPVAHHHVVAAPNITRRRPPATDNQTATPAAYRDGGTTP